MRLTFASCTIFCLFFLLIRPPLRSTLFPYTTLFRSMIEQRTGQPGVNVFKQALSNVKPALEVKSRRVGGATYQVPVEVRPERRTALGMRWIIQYSRARKEKTMAERLAAELILASKGEGETIKKKEDTHRMAEANRAFAHYRW